MGNEMSIPTSVEAIAVYCAHCRRQLGPSQEKHLYARVLCPTDSRHLAAVVKGSAGEFWLRVEAAILKWETAYSPMCWFRGWGGLFRGRTGRYLAARFATLVGLLVLACYPPAWVTCCGILSTILSLAALLLLADILISSTSVAFVSRSPANPLRSALLTAFAFAQIAIAFAVFYVLFGEFNLGLNPVSAMYFSVVTITTLGYGDIHLTEKAWIGQLIVVCQLLVAVYFVSTVFAVVATWTNAPLAAPPILELKDAVPQKASNNAVERTAGSHSLAAAAHRER